MTVIFYGKVLFLPLHNFHTSVSDITITISLQARVAPISKPIPIIIFQSLYRWDMGWTDGDSIPGRSKIYFFLHVVQTRSGADTVSYPMGNRGSFGLVPSIRVAELYLHSPYFFMS
jgi:hypothetical protein